MKDLDTNKVALVLGSFFGLAHLGWSLIVAAGVAQAWMDWIFDLHFIANPYQVKSFDLTKAVMLVLVTFVAGYVLGWAFGFIWNKVARRS